MSGKLPTQTYQDILPDKIDFEFLRNKLKLKNLETKTNFSKKFPHVDKFFKEKGLSLDKLREHSAKLIGAGALTGSLLFASGLVEKILPSPQEIIEKITEQGEIGPLTVPQRNLLDNLKNILPENVRPLNRDEEKKLERVFEDVIGIKAKGTLEGEHLNTTYGFIGAEQHLRRFSGDTLALHGGGSILKEGMAPGLGAWGYFAPSREKLTPDLEETEKWYAVVQTLYLPDWNKRFAYLRDWYKYRKVLLVNTSNGNAVVAGIADSGPAAWTGKHYGGSPEVMEYLGGPGYKKGPVVLFFVDDPENKVALGPVDYNKQSLLLRSKINLPEIALKKI